MKSKKGFTLVELLAVVAIVAILAIIALPNVIKMFNESRKESFKTEVKELVSTAGKQFMQDSMIETKDRVYSRCNDGCSNPLKMTGRKELEYYIEMDSAGRIIKLFARDGVYQYIEEGEITSESIGDVQEIAGLADDQILKIYRSGPSITRYVYYVSREELRRGQPLPEGAITYSNYQDAVNAFGYNFFIYAKIKDNLVDDIKLGFLWEGKDYYLDSLPSNVGYSAANNYFIQNRKYLESIVGKSNCKAYTYEYDCKIGNGDNVYTYQSTGSRAFNNNVICDQNYSSGYCGSRG